MTRPTTRKAPVWSLVALLLIGLALVSGTACSGDGGASPAVNGPDSFAGCSPSKAVSASTVHALAASYDPRCVRVRLGESVTFEANMMHPLQGMTEHGDTPNPITEQEPSTGYVHDVTVVFRDRGAFGFYCNVHGSDTSSAGSMTGVVYVE